jgi:aryl-alcohol dehydrogenase-like predicted oxidoreductase
MGIAMQGMRDKVFLMSKFCNFHGRPEDATVAKAMEQLEDSLRRLKTDHLDLWMMHNVSGDDAEDAYKKDGAIEAMELAQKQGKIRYTGFTGHTDPQVHTDLIQGGYEWDGILMPVSVVGALKSRQFEEQNMELIAEKNIAVLGMKGFGGSRRTHLHGKTNAEEILQYSLSYPQVCTHVVGVDKLEYVDQAVAASSTTPMAPADRARYAVDEIGDAAALAHGGALYERDACCNRGHQGGHHA